MRHADRMLTSRHAIVLMVSLAVPIATIPRATACECAATMSQGAMSQGASQCPCCQPIVAPTSCCTLGSTSGSCCSEESGQDCDCPKCQGDHLLKLNVLAKSDRLAIEGLSQTPGLTADVQTPGGIWGVARISERPPPEVYLARHGPQLERLCRWLI